ncbi:MAG: tRNA pseudouridine(38-40) synthase TruA [Candidatus Omnitrophica bacterium]|nr:tRNA pseudouridine(38-40) synthase TruA [Candidatus Omnitrophota bacterium]
MRNLKLTVEYDGTNYCGWQKQKNSLSIQQLIEDNLSKILDHKVNLKATGRTDAGVHAKQQIVNLFTSSNIPLRNLKKAINSVLPDDIAVKNIKQVSNDFDAQYSPKTKIYRYSIYTGKNKMVFDRKYVAHYPVSLDINAIRHGAKYIIGKHDFSCFRSSNSPTKTSVRTVKKIDIKVKGDYLFIDIEADGFLYNMVRIIVGTLLEVGRGKRNPSSMKELIESKKRTLAGQTAKAHGLCLLRVKY